MTVWEQERRDAPTPLLAGPDAFTTVESIDAAISNAHAALTFLDEFAAVIAARKPVVPEDSARPASRNTSVAPSSKTSPRSTPESMTTIS